MESARASEQRLVSELSDDLASGVVEPARIDAAVARVTETAARVHHACVAPLNDLHAVLTPVERSALVDKVEAHWAVWRESNGGEADPTNPEAVRLRAHLDHGNGGGQ
jgi:hypothetical protein